MILGICIGIGVLLLVATVGLGDSRIRRLHRLHLRVDAAWTGLDAALRRRAAAALVVADLAPDAVVAPPAPTSHPAGGVRGAPTGCDVAARGAAAAARLRHAAFATGGGGGRGAREGVENLLGRLLDLVDHRRLPDEVRADLAEAELVLVLARRMHNDAVRDTLVLRSRRMVRWLRLAGTAPLPAYFEIADPATRLGVTTAAPRTTRVTRGDTSR